MHSSIGGAVDMTALLSIATPTSSSTATPTSSNTAVTTPNSTNDEDKKGTADGGE